MRWSLLLITLIFTIKDVENVKKRLRRNSPSYLLGRGVPSHLSNLPNYLRIISGRNSLPLNHISQHEYPIDFQSLLQRLENKMTLGILDKEELGFIYDASGLSCLHGADFTVTPNPHHDWDCHQAITCFCITRNSYLCSYESNCTVLLSKLLIEEDKVTETEYEEVNAEQVFDEGEDNEDKEQEGENDYGEENLEEDSEDDEELEGAEYEEENAEQVQDEDYEEGDYDNEEQDEENNYGEENEEEDSEDDDEQEDEGEYKDEDKLGVVVPDKHKYNIMLCEEGSIHRFNNFLTPPCMVCLCLDHWTMFCATKPLRLCLYDNNRDENGKIIKEGRVKHKTGYGILDDANLLRSALDEVTAMKEWTETNIFFEN